MTVASLPTAPKLRSLLRVFVPPFITAIVILLFWALLSKTGKVPSYLLPSPGRFVAELVQNHNYYFKHSFVTFSEAVLGMLLAAAVGFLAGTVFVLNEYLERMILPYGAAMQAVPIVAVAPLLILWFGEGMLSKVFMAALICTSPMLINCTRGLRSIDEDSFSMMSAFGANPWQIYRKLRLPSALPLIISGLKISAALSMIGAIVAEYEGADAGLGYVLTQATYRLDTPAIFVAIFCAMMGGLFLYSVVQIFEVSLLRSFYPDKQHEE